MYPGLMERIKAALIDAILLIMLMFIVTQIFSILENVGETPRIITFLVIFLLYDPLMTSTFGGTLGHLIIGIRVRKINDPNKKINLPFAIIRFLIKAFLGWISLITVTLNDEKRALHDMGAQSIVVYK